MDNQIIIFFEKLLAFILPIALNLLYAIIIIIIGVFISRYAVKSLKKILEKSGVDLGATSFICSVSKVLLISLVILIALGQLIDITSMVATLGAVGLTASFALQGSLSNFVSGIQVIFSKPFKVGDFLSVGTFMGSVSNITVLNTTLVTPDNKEIIVPNSKMTTDIIINYTAQKARRLDLSYSVSYSIDTDIPKKIITDLVDSHADVLKDPAPIIAVGEHEASSVQILVRIWVENDLYWDVYYYMQEEVKKAFDKNGIEIPFPQLDVHNIVKS